jgi:SWI/SNF-related matrix-associated actin-dependent regulator 1 of chromatin subfamily A
MYRSPDAWTLLPKFKYLVVYESREQFKIECNRIALPPAVVSKKQPWDKLKEVTEVLRKTNLPVVELAPYVKEAMLFRLKKTENVPSVMRGCPFWSMLYGYQKQAVLWCIHTFDWRIALTDDMGLGKTLQALAMVSIYMHEHAKAKMLLLAPAFLIKDWEANVEKRLAFAKERITVLSYDKAKLRAKELKKEKYTLFIADEAHSMKNPKSARYRKLAPILKRVKGPKLLLTGTPSTNKSNEYFALLSILHPKVFKTYKAFVERYWCKISRKGRNVKELAMILPLFGFIRRSKEDVLSLPPKFFETIVVDEPVAKKSIHNLLKEIQDEPDKSMVRFLIGASYHELARIKANSDKVKAVYTKVVRDKRPAKMIVFCQHLDMLAKAEKWARESGVEKIEVIHGGVSAHARNVIVHSFQSGNVDILCCTIPAAGVGLTLTAATEVIFLEINWQRGLMQQSIDRAHRIGQTQPVTVTKIVCEGSLDDWIVRSANGKKKMQTLLLHASRQLSTDDGLCK